MTPSLPQSKSLPAAASLAAARAAGNAVVIFVRSTWKALRNRRRVGSMLEFDDHMLRDIGLTRCDVAASLSGPLLEDPSTRLRVLAVERRAGQRAQARERMAEWPANEMPLRAGITV